LFSIIVVTSFVQSILIYPDAWIVLGGVLAAVSEMVIKKTEIDLCIVGDGEIAWVNFLDYVKDFNTNKDWNYERLY